MPARINVRDFVGKKFNKLTIIGTELIEHKVGCKITKVLCKCECGVEKLITFQLVRTGGIKSCGCLHRQGLIARNTTHGLSSHPLYNVYKKMNNRCYDTGNKDYYLYGQKGVIICEEWISSFKSFYDWSILNGYKKELTIDRIDSNGNYEPSNCRWVTDLIQARNTSRNRRILYRGEVRCLSEWCEVLNLKYSSIRARFHQRKDLTIDEIFEWPLYTTYKKH